MNTATGPRTHPAFLTQYGTAPRRPSRGRPGRGRWTTAVFFILPAFLVFGLLVLTPISVAIYLSLFRWNGMGEPENMIGLDNFSRLFENPIFWQDLLHGLVLILLALAVQLPLSLGLAILLNQRIAGRAVYRMLFFAPYMLSEAVTAVLFLMILSPEAGPANRFLAAIGLEPWPWLSDPDTALPTLFLVITWKYFGFHMILYLTGLQNIPRELLEAAAMDGARPWKIFRSVTLPLLGPTIRISVFLSVIGTVQLFDLVWIMTGGGPSHSSETLAVTLFEYGFRRSQVGYACAISVVMFLISLAFALGYQRYVLRRDLEGAITSYGEPR